VVAVRVSRLLPTLTTAVTVTFWIAAPLVVLVTVPVITPPVPSSAKSRPTVVFRTVTGISVPLCVLLHVSGQRTLS
jgi:hypothetical protein